MKKSIKEQGVLNNVSRKHYFVLGAIISMIAVGHFALQMLFIQSENSRYVETAAKTSVQLEYARDAESQKPVIEPVTDAPSARPLDTIAPQRIIRGEIETQKIVYADARTRTAERKDRVENVTAAVPARPQPKKNRPRVEETNQFRRAEQILTGF